MNQSTITKDPIWISYFSIHKMTSVNALDESTINASVIQSLEGKAENDKPKYIEFENTNTKKKTLVNVSNQNVLAADSYKITYMFQQEE